MNLTKSKRNLLVTLLSFMVGMIYFIPFIRISFYDQTIAALNLTNTQLGFLGSIYGTLAIFCYAVGGILAQKFSPRILIGISLAGTGAHNAVAGNFSVLYQSYHHICTLCRIHYGYTLVSLYYSYEEFWF